MTDAFDPPRLRDAADSALLRDALRAARDDLPTRGELAALAIAISTATGLPVGPPSSSPPPAPATGSAPNAGGSTIASTIEAASAAAVGGAGASASGTTAGANATAATASAGQATAAFGAAAAVVKGLLAVAVSGAIGVAGAALYAGLDTTPSENRSAPTTAPNDHASEPSPAPRNAPHEDASPSTPAGEAGAVSARGEAASPEAPAPLGGSDGRVLRRSDERPSRIADPPAPSGDLPLLTAARAALASSPRDALSLLERHRRLYPRSALSQERSVLEIEALLGMGRREAAARGAQRFVESHPDSPHASRYITLLREFGRGPDTP